MANMREERATPVDDCWFDGDSRLSASNGVIRNGSIAGEEIRFGGVDRGSYVTNLSPQEEALRPLTPEATMEEGRLTVPRVPRVTTVNVVNETDQSSWRQPRPARERAIQQPINNDRKLITDPWQWEQPRQRLSSPIQPVTSIIRPEARFTEARGQWPPVRSAIQAEPSMWKADGYKPKGEERTSYEATRIQIAEIELPVYLGEPLMFPSF